MRRAQIGLKPDDPTAIGRRATQGDLFMIEEEILVHSTQIVKQSCTDQHTGTRDPIHPAPVYSFGRVVLALVAWQPKLAEDPRQGGKRSHRGLGRTIGVGEPQANDPQPGVVMAVVVKPLQPVKGRFDRRGVEFHVGVEDPQPGAPGVAATGVDPGGEAVVDWTWQPPDEGAWRFVVATRRRGKLPPPQGLAAERQATPGPGDWRRRGGRGVVYNEHVQATSTSGGGIGQTTS